MSIQRLQQYKASYFNQKKTISHVEKSPWYKSETFKDLCRANDYCFALCFIWVTHLNECVGQNELFLNLIVRSIQHYHNKAHDSSYMFPYSHLATYGGDPSTELNTTKTLFLVYEKAIIDQSVETNPYFTLTQSETDAALGGAVQYGTFNDVQSLTDMLTDYKQDVEKAIILNKTTSNNSHDQAVTAGFIEDEVSDCDSEPFSFPKDKLHALQISESLVEILEDYKDDIKKAIDAHAKKGVFIITYNNDISHAVSYKKNFDLGKYEFLDTGNFDQPIRGIETIDDLKSLVINLYDTYLAIATKTDTKTYIVFLYFESCFSTESDYHYSKRVKLDHSK